MLSPRLLACLACLSLALTAACDRGGEAGRQEQATSPDSSSDDSTKGGVSRAQAGNAAPDIPFQTMAGDEARLSDYAGRPVLVNLWATWCIPCVKELPALKRLAERHDDIVLLPISQDFEGAETVVPFLGQNDLEGLEAYLDLDNGWLSSETGIAVLPTSIYYDANGKEVWRVTGEIDWDSEEADALIAEGL